MVCTIFLVRHCQSIANSKRLYNCTMEEDKGLSELGFRQAEKVGKYLAEVKLKKIYSSPFLRAIQTANAIAKNTGAAIEAIKSFRELDCGKWNGKTEIRIMKEYLEAWKGWHYDPQNNPIPRGETLLEVQARVLPTFEALIRKNNGEKICIVSHYCIINVLLCSLVASLGNFRSFDTKNGTVAEINLENVPRLVSYNCP